VSVLCVFILCLCSVCRYRPCDLLIPRPRSPTIYRIKKLKKATKAKQKDCRAILLLLLLLIILIIIVIIIYIHYPICLYGVVLN
jgi:uncharacterized membrane protein